MLIQNERKLFILDTSVLLYDKACLENMQGNDIVIPLVVLEELDRFKNKEGILGENSRHFNRYFDNLRKLGSLQRGVSDEEINVKLFVSSSERWENLECFDKNKNDNIIIANLNSLSLDRNDQYNKIVLITKDINLRVKCDSVGLIADDYYADYEFINSKNLYKGHSELTLDGTFLDRLYNNGILILSNNTLNDTYINENEFVILKSSTSNQSCLCRMIDGNLVIVEKEGYLKKETGIDPKNKEQSFALELLIDDDIPLVTLTGVPGSGKTYLTLMTALRQIERNKKTRIIFTRPIQTVGKDIGFLPGTMNEKMAPWLAPIVDNFRNQFGDLSYFELMMEKGQIDIAPLSYIRGRSFNDAIIIVDEAQNATIHELKTVITRTGKNSKIVLLGDVEQVDIPYVDKFSNGLTIVTEKLKKEKLTGHVHFAKGYRSELSNIVAKVL